MKNVDLRLLREELKSLLLIASEQNLPITRESDREIDSMGREQLDLQIARLHRLLRVPRGH